jgi:hypothetical protein
VTADDALDAPQRIRKLAAALAWGASWEKAYYEERRARLREIKALQDRIFELEHALKAEQFERALDAAAKG